MFTYNFRPPPINIYVPPFPNANYEMQDLINDHGIVDVLGANYKIAGSR